MSMKTIQDFLKLEAAGGIVLMATATLAIILANSPLSEFYDLLLGLKVVVAVGSFEIAKPLLLWINDGLMAIFFFLIGLELKREFIEGDLSKPGYVALPLIGAVGGMLAPALCYVALNYDDPVAIDGWAIPTATDIAFVLGILAIIGKKVPLSLKVFLTSLAIFDDLGAIIVIALFYTDQLSTISIAVAATVIAVLFALNNRKVTETMPYIIAGLILWVAVLKSGIHATLAGVLLAMFIPMRGKEGEPSPLKTMEHNLHSSVAFIIVPVFAFANAGIDLSGVDINAVASPVPLGIILGLFVGKQFGVFTFCWLAVKLGFASMPKGMNFTLLYGAAIICGVGFTMSLFIGSLAFSGVPTQESEFQDRLGIIIGSLLSGVLGYIWLKLALRNREPE